MTHITIEREALQKVLDTLEENHHLIEQYERSEYLALYDRQITVIKKALAAPVLPVAIDGNTSDGYHTFNELYEFRKAYNAALFNEWAAGGKCSVHKSWRHHDGELCFGGGWFIVVAVLPQGQISNHYEAKDWDLFAVPETERALFEFDGHTGADVVERLKTYTTPPAQPAPVQEAAAQDAQEKCRIEDVPAKGGLVPTPPAQPAPAQEPVAWMYQCTADNSGPVLLRHRTNWAESGTGLWTETPLYTTPPAAQRQWVGLTDDERDAIFELHHTRLGGWDHGGDEVMYDKHFEDAVAAIEAKLKEKNT